MSKYTVDGLVEMMRSDSVKPLPAYEKHSIGRITVPASAAASARELYSSMIRYFAGSGVGRVTDVTSYPCRESSLEEIADEPMRSRACSFTQGLTLEPVEEFGLPQVFFSARLMGAKGEVVVWEQEPEYGAAVKLDIRGDGYSCHAVKAVVDHLRSAGYGFELEVLSKSGPRSLSAKHVA